MVKESESSRAAPKNTSQTDPIDISGRHGNGVRFVALLSIFLNPTVIDLTGVV